jgi:hypothetical protein
MHVVGTVFIYIIEIHMLYSCDTFRNRNGQNLLHLFLLFFSFSGFLITVSAEFGDFSTSVSVERKVSSHIYQLWELRYVKQVLDLEMPY